MSDQCFWLDMGNSRCKWQWQGRDYVGAETELLDFVTDITVDQWLVSSVRPFALSQLERLPWIKPSVKQGFGGFYLQYEPERLGLDRWLAMLAVRPKLALGQTAIVVDMGTATTFDLFTYERHLGGLITVGFNTMKKALFNDTAQLRQAQFDGQLQLAHSTDQAIGRGYYWPIQLLLSQWLQQYPGAMLICTGGDAGALMPLLPQAKWQDDLVLQGLRYWYESGEVDA